MIKFHVTNDILSVGHIELLAVSSASMLQIGDTDRVVLSSMFDTPPESLIVGPLAPLPVPEDAQSAAGESAGEEGEADEAAQDDR
ncbi:hypothetical protein ACFO9Q_11560 [Paenibacillus sp. GCM10023252]|uniref:hypothetical protein n=1 Tax=Paenibacillus sp. GCM10023252 TaxID=3252649 RepID=UPI003623CFE9